MCLKNEKYIAPGGPLGIVGSYRNWGVLYFGPEVAVIVLLFCLRSKGVYLWKIRPDFANICSVSGEGTVPCSPSHPTAFENNIFIHFYDIGGEESRWWPYVISGLAVIFSSE